MSRSSSAVVDTKVAELQLDNSNFEKNAATTISTVQELQKALNFSVSGKNFDEINASVKKVNFDPINKGIETTKAGFSALEAVAFGAFARIGSKIADVGMNIASAIPKQIVAGGKTRALNVQQAKFQIQGLADSMNYVGDAWEDLSADIDHAVSGTAYGMDVAALAASQLMASGIKFGETFGPTGSSPMAKALRGISGVAAMTSSSYEEITNIFTKIAGQGSIMGGELQQLASRGLNVSADLAKFFNGVNDGSIQASETVTKAVKDVTTSVNTSEADIMDWASKRKISFEVFAEAMDRAYGEHATEANKTFAGSLTNVKAQLSKIGEVFAEPVFRNGQKFFSSLYDVVKDLRIIIQNSKFAKWFDETADKVGDKFASAFGKAHNALQNFINSKDNKTVETFRTAFGGIFDKVDEKTGVISKMRDYFGLGEVAKDAEENSKKIEGSFDSVKDTVLSTIRGDYANGMERVKNLTEAGFNPEQIQGYVNQLWELTGHDWSKLSDDIYAQVTAQEELSEATEETGKTTEESIGPIGHVLSGLLNLWSGISNVVGIAKNLLTGAWNSFTGVEGPVGRIAEKFDEISASFNEFTQSHAGEIEQVFTGIGNAVLLVWDALSMGSKFVFGFVSGILEGFGTTLWDVILAVSNAITNFRAWIKENRILERTIDVVRAGAKWLTTTLRGLWDSFLNLPLVKKAVESFGEVFTHLRDNFLSVTQKGGKVLKNFWSMIKNGFKFSKDPKQLFGNIKGAFTYLWSEIKNSVTFSKIKEAFGNIKEYIATFFDDLGKNEDGSLNTFGKLQQGFGKFISGIGNSIKQFQKDGSFSNLFGNIKLTFQGLWNSVKSSGFFENIKKGFNTVRTAIDDFLTGLGTNADGTQNWFGKTYTFVKNFASGVWENLGILGNGFKGFFTSLPGFISGIPEKFQEFLDKVHDLGGFKFENLGDIWQAFKDTIWKYFQDGDLFQPIVDAFGTLKDNIKQKLEENGVDVDGIIENLTSFKDRVVEIFTNISNSISESFGDLMEIGPFKAFMNLFTGDEAKADELKESGEKIKEGGKILEEGGGYLSKFLGFFEGINAGTIIKVIGAIIAFKALSGVAKVITEIKDAVIGFINSEANLKNAQAKDIERQGKANAWLKIAASIAIIAFAIYKIGSLDVASIEQGAIVVGAIAVAFLAFNWLASKLIKAKDIADVGDGLLRFAGAIAIIAIVASAVSLVPWSMLERGLEKVAAIGGLLLVAGVVLGLLGRLGGGHMSDAAGALKTFADVIEKVAIIATAMSLVPWGTLNDGIDKMTAIMEAIMAPILIIAIVGRLAGTKAIAPLATIAIVIGAIAGILFLLGKYGDVDKYSSIAESIGGLLTTMAAVIGLLGILPASTGFKAALAVVSFVGILTAIGGALAALDDLTGGAFTETLSEAGDMVGKLGEVIGKLVGGVFAGAIEKMAEVDEADFDKIVSFIQKLADIQIPMQSMTKFSFTEGFEHVDQSFSSFARGVAGVVNAVNEVDVSEESNFEEKKAYFEDIVNFVQGLAAIEIDPQVTVKLSLLEGFEFVDTSLEKFARGIQGVVDAVNDIDVSDTSGYEKKKEFFTDIVKFTNDLAAIDIDPQITTKFSFHEGYEHIDQSLEKFAKGMQRVVDAVNSVELSIFDIATLQFKKQYFEDIVNFTSGLADIKIDPQIETKFSLHEGYEHIDTSLQKFAQGMQGVVDAVNAVEFDEGDVSTMKEKRQYFEDIADFTKKLAAIDIPAQESLESKGWFDSSYVDNSLKTFADGMAKVVEAVNGVKFSLFDVLTLKAKAKYFQDIGDFVEDLAGIEIPTQTENITKWNDEGFFSESNDSSLITFAEGMGKLGEAVNSMTVPTISLEDVQLMADCVKVLAKAAAFIPPVNTGISEWFKGDNSLATFAQNIQEAAPNIVAASKAAVGLDADSLNELTGAIKPMITIMSSIVEGSESDPNYFINMAGQLGGFAQRVEEIGTAFSSLSGIKDVHIEDIERIPEIMDALKKVSNEGLADFGDFSGGDNPFANLSEYIAQISTIAVGVDLDGLTLLTTSLSTLLAVNLDSGDIFDESIVTTYCNNIQKLSGLIAGLNTLDTSGVDKFKDALKSINESDLSTANQKLEEATESAKQTGSKMGESITSGLDSGAIGSGISSALTSAMGGIDVSGFSSIGQKIAGQIAAGISKASGTIKTVIGTVIKNASDAVSKYKSDFGSAGTNLVTGLANGIRNNKSAAINAAADVAAQALAAAKDRLKIQSPSKEMERVGMYFDFGFAKGVSKFASKVYDESSDVARLAMDGLSQAVMLANDILEDGDVQPVIRPVLDLSDVESGALGLNGMFNTAPFISTNLGAIGANADAMRSRNTTDDILTALSELGQSMNTGTGDTYIIDGVTYDDGSNVSDAVQRLIRAAKIERRA